MFNPKSVQQPAQPANDGLVGLISGLSSMLSSFGVLKSSSNDKIELKDDENGQLFGSFLSLIQGQKAPIKSISKDGTIKTFIKPG